ncbi:hypothetical protein Q5P01_000677 [Channa striata]|uniref:Uncharacterized protein n=1 Tax=Channa striata TaxID=64152 RepID=A0AA88IIG1_CHASR|nr:hypothetical protein Q5P01_000677 [Channa striata]
MLGSTASSTLEFTKPAVYQDESRSVLCWPARITRERVAEIRRSGSRVQSRLQTTRGSRWGVARGGKEMRKQRLYGKGNRSRGDRPAPHGTLARGINRRSPVGELLRGEGMSLRRRPRPRELRVPRALQRALLFGPQLRLDTRHGLSGSVRDFERILVSRGGLLTFRKRAGVQRPVGRWDSGTRSELRRAGTRRVGPGSRLSAEHRRGARRGRPRAEIVSPRDDRPLLHSPHRRVPPDNRTLVLMCFDKTRTGTTSGPTLATPRSPAVNQPSSPKGSRGDLERAYPCVVAVALGECVSRAASDGGSGGMGRASWRRTVERPRPRNLRALGAIPRQGGPSIHSSRSRQARKRPAGLGEEKEDPLLLGVLRGSRREVGGENHAYAGRLARRLHSRRRDVGLRG